jgi:hypothetical protein
VKCREREMISENQVTFYSLRGVGDFTPFKDLCFLKFCSILFFFFCLGSPNLAHLMIIFLFLNESK